MYSLTDYYFLFHFSLKLFVTLDSSGPTIALDTTSVTCRAVFAEIRAKKTVLHLPRYTPAELLSSGLIYG